MASVHLGLDAAQRLDVIFASSYLTAMPCGPLKLDPADLVAATDHLPVWADLDLSRVAPS